MKVFSGSGGKVAVVNVPHALPALVKVPGFPTQNVLITEVSFARGVNAQAMPALNWVVYVYVFGRKMTPTVVRGLTIEQPCSGSGGGRALNSFWEDNNVLERQSPVTIAVGPVVIRGLLLDMKYTLTAQELGMGRFELSFLTIG